MADAYGSVRSNSFGVKSAHGFRKWLSEQDFGFGNAEMEVYLDEVADDHDIVIMGDPDAQYPDIVPISIDPDSDNEDRLPEFVAGLRQHMIENEVFCLMAQSNEKLASQVCSRLIVTHNGFRIDNFDPDFDRDTLQALVEERNDENDVE